MAIGNAPWPIGVTMVGIHARTGREKIFAQHVARILLLICFFVSAHCFSTLEHEVSADEKLSLELYVRRF